MYVIGLTGGIASGKSTASRTLRNLGAQIIDADAIAHDVSSPGGAAEGAIMARFGTLDRRELGRIVFADASARQVLNGIIHPLVQQEINRQLATATAPVVVLDIPLLFESGMEHMADEVWVVHVPREEQIARIMVRDGLSEADAIARIDSQMPTADKILLGDVDIDTSGPYAQTQKRIETLYRDVLQRAGVQPAPLVDMDIPRRRRTQAQRSQQQLLEAQASTPVLSQTRPMQRVTEGAWEDTSTLLEIPEQRTFFARQPRIFWVATAILLLALLLVLGIIGANAWKEMQAERAEAQRLEQLAQERATYKLEYRDILEHYAQEYDVDPALVAAVIYNESRFRPGAESNLGARGLMQIMPDTGDWIAMRLGEKDTYTFDLMYEPEANVRYGVWFLSYLEDMYGSDDIVKIAAGYHAGQYSVVNWLQDPAFSSDGVTLENIPYADTAEYVKRVVNTYAMYQKHYYGPDVEALPST